MNYTDLYPVTELIVFLGSEIFFVVSLILFIRDRVKNKKNPGSVTGARLRTSKILFIVSLVLHVLVVLYFVGVLLFLGIIMSRAMSHM